MGNEEEDSNFDARLFWAKKNNETTAQLRMEASTAHAKKMLFAELTLKPLALKELAERLGSTEQRVVHLTSAMILERFAIHRVKKRDGSIAFSRI